MSESGYSDPDDLTISGWAWDIAQQWPSVRTAPDHIRDRLETIDGARSALLEFERLRKPWLWRWNKKELWSHKFLRDDAELFALVLGIDPPWTEPGQQSLRKTRAPSDMVAKITGEIARYCLDTAPQEWPDSETAFRKEISIRVQLGHDDSRIRRLADATFGVLEEYKDNK